MSDTLLKEEPHLTTQEMWDRTERGLQETIDRNIPSKSVKGYQNPPWFSNDIKLAFQRRNTAYRKWVRTNSHHDELEFHQLKAEAQTMWRSAKDTYTHSIFEP